MDPLSIIASTIAILQAGGAVGGGLKKLISLKDAPAILLNLNHDAADLELVIRAVGDLPSTILEKEIVHAALERAKYAVLELEECVAYCLTSASSTFSAIKVRRRKWFSTAEDKIRELRLKLRDAKIDLITATGVVNVASAHAVAVHIENISLRTSRIESQLQQLYLCSDNISIKSFRNCKTLQDSVEAEQSQNDVRGQKEQLPPSLQNTIGLSKLDTARTATDNGTDDVLRSGTISQTTLPSNNSMFDPANGTSNEKLSLLVKCSNLPCLCSCHKHSRQRSPKSWDWILGSLSIENILLPLMVREFDVGGCKRRSSSFTINYAVPICFLNYRLFLQFSRRPHGSPELLLRIFRTRPKDAEIFIAAQFGCLEPLQRILENGQGSLLDVDETGQSVLSMATGNHRFNVVQLVLHLGADRHQEDNNGCSPDVIFWNDQLIRGLRKSDIYGTFDPESYDYTDIQMALLGFGAEPLYSTISATSRANVDEKDRLGRSALNFAAMLGNVAAVEHLLKKGADPNSEDNENKVPLFYAITCGSSCCFQVLLDAGANPHHVDTWGNSLLTRATMNLCDNSILDSLYNCGININARNYFGRTALSIIVFTVYPNEQETRYIKILNWVLEHRADINVKNNRGQTAIMLAIQHNRHRMLEILLRKGADINKSDMEGRTLVLHAAIDGDLIIFYVLQAADLQTIKLNTRDQWNRTAIWYASGRRFHNEEWSNWRVTDMDADPEECSTVGMTVEKIEEELRDLEEKWGQDWYEWIDSLLDRMDARNGEEKSDDKLDITNKIPGAFPDE